MSVTINATIHTADAKVKLSTIEEILQLLDVLERGGRLSAHRQHATALALAVSTTDTDISRAMKFRLVLGRELDAAVNAKEIRSLIQKKLANPSAKADGVRAVLAGWAHSGMEMLDTSAAAVAKSYISFMESYPGINLLVNVTTVSKAAAVSQYRAVSENPVGVMPRDVVTAM